METLLQEKCYISKITAMIQMLCNAELHHLYCCWQGTNQLQLLNYQSIVLLYTISTSTRLKDIATATYATAYYEYSSMLSPTSDNTRAVVGVSQYHPQ